MEGFLSPSRCGSRNGEKDWENASTTSSVASGTEYTGGHGCALRGREGGLHAELPAHLVPLQRLWPGLWGPGQSQGVSLRLQVRSGGRDWTG